MTKQYKAEVKLTIAFGCPDEDAATQWITWILEQMKEEYETETIWFRLIPQEIEHDNIHK